ncbi:MAG: YggS family pyridoxal phosphate-dependent enzyme [Deltaproteobacteria bacterium]|nr:YggS family pyridoxal phosphate-dependent enzyme [Deltaproteobacteria bacterium]
MNSTLAENILAVRERIASAAGKAGRHPDSVRLLAVSKTRPAQEIQQAFAAGQLLFGENYVQEALEKMEQTGPGPQWHLIGHLQSNKARLIPGRFALVHTVDSEKLARALGRHAEQAGLRLEVLLQLNWSGEDTKSGITEESSLRLVLQAVRECPALILRGFMTIPDPALNETGTRRVYSAIRELHQRVGSEFGLGPEFNELSFGMSHDFEWAIAEGATLVRVGTAIFGARS